MKKDIFTFFCILNLWLRKNCKVTSNLIHIKSELAERKYKCVYRKQILAVDDYKEEASETTVEEVIKLLAKEASQLSCSSKALEK